MQATGDLTSFTAYRECMERIHLYIYGKSKNLFASTCVLFTLVHTLEIIIGRYAFAYWKHFSLSVCYMCTSYVVNVIVFDSQLNFFPKPIDNRHMQSCVVLFLGDFCVVPFRVFL